MLNMLLAWEKTGVSKQELFNGYGYGLLNMLIMAPSAVAMVTGRRLTRHAVTRQRAPRGVAVGVSRRSSAAADRPTASGQPYGGRES